jgi:hypothetical protein
MGIVWRRLRPGRQLRPAGAVSLVHKRVFAGQLDRQRPAKAVLAPGEEQRQKMDRLAERRPEVRPAMTLDRTSLTVTGVFLLGPSVVAG